MRICSLDFAWTIAAIIWFVVVSASLLPSESGIEPTVYHEPVAPAYLMVVPSVR